MLGTSTAIATYDQFPYFATRFNRLVALAEDHHKRTSAKAANFRDTTELLTVPTQNLRSFIDNLTSHPEIDEGLKIQLPVTALKPFTQQLAVYVRMFVENLVLNPIINNFPAGLERFTTNLRSGLANMIEMFFGFTNLIPVLYQEQMGHPINSQNFEEILLRTKEHLKEYTKLQYDIFFRHLKNILKGYEDRIPGTYFPDLDFKPQFFEIAKLDTTQDLTLVPKIHAIEAALTTSLAQEPPLKDAAIICPAAKFSGEAIESLVDVTFDFMMYSCKKFFFPIWEQIREFGMGDSIMPPREQFVAAFNAPKPASGNCPFHRKK